MARFLKQSTSVDVPIGPFLDSTDGVTAETALTLTQPDIRLKKNGGAWAQKAAAQTLSHEENGYYEVTLDSTDTDTLGLLRLAVAESGALPVWEDFLVVPANVWDSLFGADKLQVDAVEVSGTTQTAGDLAALVTAVDNFVDTEIAAIQTSLTTIDGKIDTVDDLLDTEIAAIQTTLGTPAGVSVSADIAAVKTDTAAILVDTDTTIPGLLSTIDTVVDSILADTGTDGVVIVNAGITSAKFAASAIDAAALATDAVNEIRNAVTGGAYALATEADGMVQANVKEINDVTLGGTGTLADEWGPA